MNPQPKKRERKLLLFVAGLGGLLYGIDVGIIAGVLPYMEATFKDSASGLPLSAGQLSVIVAAVLLGSVISTLCAGACTEIIGRRPMMIVSGVLFVLSIPMIAMADGFGPLVVGRLLQGVSAGFIGVVIPLYLAETLVAGQRGTGTGIFQWMLVAGLLASALMALAFSRHLDGIEVAAQLAEAKDFAWRSVFWISLVPGLVFIAGAFFLPESARWLFRKGRHEQARASLVRFREANEAELEMRELQAVAARDSAPGTEAGSIFRRRYVLPFLLACLILACNQATGINSIIGFNTTILLQAGLDDKGAHLASVFFTVVNFLFTMLAVVLVDRKGRKFLLCLGSGGIVVSLAAVGILFQHSEKRQVDCRESLEELVAPVSDVKGLRSDERLRFHFDRDSLARLVSGRGEAAETLAGSPCTLTVIYSVGGFSGATTAVRSDAREDKLVDISRNAALPVNSVEAFFRNPSLDLEQARQAPLRIEHALVTPVPPQSHGWAVALCLYAFMAFFAVGPGICVWLALSELMPGRIRSNGMSVALLFNTVVSTFIAAVFLPSVGAHGYSSMFFVFAGFTVVYFLAALILLPETKGRTLEEIEEHFAGGSK
ncbi:MAG: hypothetical protein RL095_630 [Verrucomicrobiota bacterium]|jgi:sugar porter (SP) family MFS transporter